MMSEREILLRLMELEKEMDAQLREAHEHGFPVLFWDKNCVERAVLRQVVGLPEVPYGPADCMAGW